MRELKIDDKTLRLRGSTLSLLYYQQEFGRDLIGDLAVIITGMAGMDVTKTGKVDLDKINYSGIDSVAILRLIWTLARTAVGPTGQFPGFVSWLEENEELDIFNDALLSAAIEEATRAFFRPKPGVASAAK